jgi:hypothetical protein
MMHEPTYIVAGSRAWNRIDFESLAKRYASEIQMNCLMRCQEMNRGTSFFCIGTGVFPWRYGANMNVFASI